MASSNVYTGFTSDKLSSRVTNPPGGRSNNIFGYDEPVKAAAPAPAPTPAPAPAPVAAQPTTSPAAQQASTYVPPVRRHDYMKSNIFGTDEPPRSNGAKSGPNPIIGNDDAKKTTTEEPFDPLAPGSRKIHTSSKVLQPPGGKSHQLW